MPGGRDHPRNGEIWKKVAVCYVEICSAFPEVGLPFFVDLRDPEDIDERQNGRGPDGRRGV